MGHFAYKRFPVYRKAIALLRDTSLLLGRVPRRAWFAVDQFLRAAASIPANIAEGAGEYPGREKARFYRIARRSAFECAAHLDVLEVLGVISTEAVALHTANLEEICAMLTAMIRMQLRRPRP